MEENTTVPALPSPSGQDTGGDTTDAQKSRTVAILIGVGIVILILLIVAAVLLIRSDNDTTGRVRDVFIIFMALESLVIGVAMVVLIVQLATLINLLQNELKPIIESTNETVNTLRGTASFLSDNVAEPVIKLNSYLAGLKQFFDLMRPGRRS
jgi:hypothetical protein